jgi:uncharacterized membrane protein YphA (DoxX/SURF4 family)
MHVALWVLQGVTALLFAASGGMKVFMFDKISAEVPSFGALPREAWLALGVIELICVVGLIIPGLIDWQPRLTVLAAAVLAVESLVFVWVHVQYREVGPIIMSGALGLVMVFIAYGRAVVSPLTRAG